MLSSGLLLSLLKLPSVTHFNLFSSTTAITKNPWSVVAFRFRKYKQTIHSLYVNMRFLLTTLHLLQSGVEDNEQSFLPLSSSSYKIWENEKKGKENEANEEMSAVSPLVFTKPVFPVIRSFSLLTQRTEKKKYY